MTHYMDPTYDRTQDDIDNKTAKAYMNVRDWNRIWNNTYVLIRAIEYYTDTMLLEVLDPINEDPEIEMFEQAVMSDHPFFNDYRAVYIVAQQINNLYVYATMTYYQYGMPAIWTSFTAGPNGRGLNFDHVNSWELRVHLMYTNLAAHFSFSSWVPNSVSPVRSPRTFVASAGSDLTNQNYFRQYD